MLPTLRAAHAWINRGVTVTLLDTHRYLYYSGMVPEYLGGVYAQEEIRIDLPALCDASGIAFEADPAIHLDPERRVITTQSGDHYSYDVIAFDVGARNPGSQEDAIPTKPLHHVEQLEDQITTTLRAPEDALHLTIAGGGTAGVEVALNVVHRFAAANRSEALHLTVVEQQTRLLSDLPKGLSRYAERTLSAHGVTVHTATTVDSVDNGAVELSDGTNHLADAVLWATGSAGPSLFEGTGLPTDERGFLHVLPTLQCPGYPRLFAAGDCATVYNQEEQRKVGVHAVKQGATLRSNLERALKGIASGQPSRTWVLDSFQPYPMAPLILSTGTHEGIWTTGLIWLRGTPFLRLKHAIDRRWINRYNDAFEDADLSDLITDDAAVDAPLRSKQEPPASST